MFDETSKGQSDNLLTILQLIKKKDETIFFYQQINVIKMIINEKRENGTNHWVQ